VHVQPRDITRRVLGRPLHSPYAPRRGPQRARWLWLLAAAWVLYAGFFSDHSLWRIARLRHELASARRELGRVQAQSDDLGARLADPHERSEHAEQVLRAQGMARPGETVYRFGGSAARADSGR
jgi:cell division protein FtsB